MKLKTKESLSDGSEFHKILTRKKIHIKFVLLEETKNVVMQSP